MLVLGLNPSRLGGIRCPTIKNLYKWLDELKLKTISFSNIYNELGKYSKQQINKDYLNEICPQYDKVLALGQTVGDVLVLLGVSHFRLPHPSGLNRQLNDQRFVHQTLRECNQYLWGNS